MFIASIPSASRNFSILLKTSFSLTYAKTFEEKSVTVSAFGLTITRNGNQSFKISIEPGEVRVIEEFIKNYLSDFFKSKSENLDKAKDNTSNNSNLSEDPPF